MKRRCFLMQATYRRCPSYRAVRARGTSRGTSPGLQIFHTDPQKDSRKVWLVHGSRARPEASVCSTEGMVRVRVSGEGAEHNQKHLCAASKGGPHFVVVALGWSKMSWANTVKHPLSGFPSSDYPLVAKIMVAHVQKHPSSAIAHVIIKMQSQSNSRVRCVVRKLESWVGLATADVDCTYSTCTASTRRSTGHDDRL